jgi:hypothetical protein
MRIRPLVMPLCLLAMAAPHIHAASLPLSSLTAHASRFTAHGHPAFVRRVIRLDFSHLPSAQGWTYLDPGTPAAETSVFSVSHGILHQNSLNVGFAGQGDNIYQLLGAVAPSGIFTVTVRARLLAETHGPGFPQPNPFGLSFGASTGAASYGLGIGLGLIGGIDRNSLTTLIDTTRFHTYRLVVVAGAGYDVFVDNALVTTGQAYADTGPSRLFLGDGTGGTNAEADITSFTFEQVTPVPPPARPAARTTLHLFSTSVAPGGQQVALVFTAPFAMTSMVITYPDGSQQVVGPQRAGPDGHFGYAWTLPGDIFGTVHVTVDSAGRVAQGSFTVS